MKLLTKSNAAFDYIIYILAIFAALLLAFIMLAVCVDVVMRYFLARPMIWVAEVTEYSLLWITFLGTTWVFKREGHVVMDLVIGKLNPETRATVNIITSVICAAVCLLLTWYGVKVTLDVFHRSLLLSTILTPPAFILFVIIPIGIFLLSIQSMRRTSGFIKSRRALLDRKQA